MQTPEIKKKGKILLIDFIQFVGQCIVVYIDYQIQTEETDYNQIKNIQIRKVIKVNLNNQ